MFWRSLKFVFFGDVLKVSKRQPLVCVFVFFSFFFCLPPFFHPPPPPPPPPFFFLHFFCWCCFWVIQIHNLFSIFSSSFSSISLGLSPWLTGHKTPTYLLFGLSPLCSFFSFSFSSFFHMCVVHLLNHRNWCRWRCVFYSKITSSSFFFFFFFFFACQM